MCFLLNLVENLYNMPQSGSSYFGLITPEPTLSYQPGDSPLGQGPGRTPPRPAPRSSLPAAPCLTLPGARAAQPGVGGVCSSWPVGLRHKGAAPVPRIVQGRKTLCDCVTVSSD